MAALNTQTNHYVSLHSYMTQLNDQREELIRRMIREIEKDMKYVEDELAVEKSNEKVGPVWRLIYSFNKSLGDIDSLFLSYENLRYDHRAHMLDRIDEEVCDLRDRVKSVVKVFQISYEAPVAYL